MHPAKDILETKSKKLSGKKIILGVTGSIAAVETVKLVRELIRHGATVIPVMTKSAQEIIGEKALHFASGEKVITEISGEVEHVKYCGARETRADLLLIAPATANTISKIASGIDDTPVTTFATTAIGTGIPVMIVPAMHETMYRHTVLQENIKKLEKLGVLFINPKIAESKAKFPEIEEIVEWVIRILGKRDYLGKKILVIGGASYEPLDEMRVITNLSTGKMSMAIAKTAFERGGDVEMLAGRMEVQVPPYIPVTRFHTVEDLMEKLGKLRIQDFQYIFVPAALSDFGVDMKKGKIPSDRTLEITLKPLPKVIIELRKQSDAIIVGFKAEATENEEILANKAYDALIKNKIDYVCANQLRNVGADSGEVLVLDRNGKHQKIKGTKEEIAERIFDLISPSTVAEKFNNH
ncbi:MAG: bifunctional phosphopantothenoylcysteine decarboxylase/phosphopantothenate--cysteine ligase CoaBC [Thermoplasmata archaeon]